MGGRLLSGGGLFSCGGRVTAGIGSCDGSGTLRSSPSPLRPLGPAMPLRDRGGRLDTSSLFVATELGIESWLLLFWAVHRGTDRSLDAVESKLPVGDMVSFGGGRERGEGLGCRGISPGLALGALEDAVILCWLAAESVVCCRGEAPVGRLPAPRI